MWNFFICEKIVSVLISTNIALIIIFLKEYYEVLHLYITYTTYHDVLVFTLKSKNKEEVDETYIEEYIEVFQKVFIFLLVFKL